LLSIARSELEQALELNPDQGEAYASLGLLNYAERDLEGANRAFNRAQELNPNYATAWFWHSWPLRDMGRWDEALAKSAKSVELDPMSVSARKSLANNLRFFGQYDQAMEQFQRIVEIDPSYYEAPCLIAMLQHSVFNRLDQAMAGYFKSIELEPKQTLSYASLVQLYLDLGEPETATTIFDRLYELAPADQLTLWSRMLLELHGGDLEGAAATARQFPANPPFLSLLSQFAVAQIRNQLLSKGQYSEALALYTDAYPELSDNQNPLIDLHNYRAAIDMALILQLNDRAEDAESYLVQIQEYLDTRFRLGMLQGFWISDVQVLALQGRSAEALIVLGQAVDDGWRTLWWYYLLQDPNLESIRSEPMFKVTVEKIMSDMAAQLDRIHEIEVGGELPLVLMRRK
jgi:tetratricopeptide (TPR) repeat protein